MRTRRLVSVSLVMVLAGACRGEEQRETTRDTTATGMGGMAGMEGMAGMAGPSSATQMMTEMQSHMAVMRGASADSMRAMLPSHRQMLGNMIARFERDMRAMNMQGDSAWSATVDSLRRDLRLMPEMSPQALHALMPAHAARVRQLSDMHRSMMANMPH